MEKVISFFKSITATFYFNFFELNKVHFGPAKVGEDLNSKFESVSKSFDPRVVQRAPPLSPLPSARRLRAAADRVLPLFVTGAGPHCPRCRAPSPTFKIRRSPPASIFSSAPHSSHHRTATHLLLTPLPLVHVGHQSAAADFTLNRSHRHRLSPTLVSSICVASSTSTESRLTFPLIPRCCRRSSPPLRVIRVPPQLKNLTAPPHLCPSPWTTCSGEPRYPLPCPDASPRCPGRGGEDLIDREAADELRGPHHRAACAPCSAPAQPAGPGRASKALGRSRPTTVHFFLPIFLFVLHFQKIV
jgi:hypothetical protein